MFQRKTPFIIILVMFLTLIPVTTIWADEAYRIKPNDTLQSIALEKSGY